MSYSLSVLENNHNIDKEIFMGLDTLALQTVDRGLPPTPLPWNLPLLCMLQLFDCVFDHCTVEYSKSGTMSDL